MNLFGKILVFLILIMSVMFMVMALIVYSTHTNWKQEITRTPAEVTGSQTVGWKARYQQLVEQNQKLTADHEALQKAVVAERTAKVEALAEMQTELSARIEELAAAQKLVEQRGQQLASATATLKTQEQNVNTATKQVQKLTQDINAQIARATDLFNKSMALNDELMQANVQLPELKERNDQLAAQIAKARLLLAQRGRTIEDPLDRRPPPLEANVESVRSQGDIEIAAGTHDGIRVGHDVDIVRGSRLLGTIRITDVDEDRAVGKLTPGIFNQQIRRGDTATTKLSRLARQP